MAAGPKLVLGDVLEADEAVVFGVDVDHAAELFHFVSLRIDAADVVDA